MSDKTALITGITGQDGSYLAEFLLERGYIIYGMERRHSVPQRDNLSSIIEHPCFILVDGDMTDPMSLETIIFKFKPDEIYNLAAQSFVGLSWSQPRLTNEVNYLGFINLLEACRKADWYLRIYQASSSEMFGNQPAPQNESTPMIPRSPYGVSKLAAHRIAQVYRESFDMFISCGICFNHESPRRGLEFVTRKIAHGVAQIVKGKKNELSLGTLDAKRDWGYAPDFVRAMWLMLQQDDPDDYVIATGDSVSVETFVMLAFDHVGLNWRDYVEYDEEFVRPAEVWDLVGDASKAYKVLNWQPTINLQQLVEKMVDAELEK